MNKYFTLVTSLCLVLILIGAGCQSAANNSNNSEVMNKPTESTDRCADSVRTMQFERIFGQGNVTVVPYTYGDDWRTAENTCSYTGYVPVDGTNYFLSVSVIPDAEQKYFAWEKKAYDGAEILNNSATLFYKKLTILPQISFGKQRKQLYGWDAVSHVGGVTYSVSAVPQFADSDEKTVREVLDGVLSSLVKK